MCRWPGPPRSVARPGPTRPAEPAGRARGPMGGAGSHATSWPLSEDCGIKELCLHVRVLAGRSAEPAACSSSSHNSLRPHSRIPRNRPPGSRASSIGVGAERALHGQQPGGGGGEAGQRGGEIGEHFPHTPLLVRPVPASALALDPACWRRTSGGRRSAAWRARWRCGLWRRRRRRRHPPAATHGRCGHRSARGARARSSRGDGGASGSPAPCTDRCEGVRAVRRRGRGAPDGSGRPTVRRLLAAGGWAGCSGGRPGPARPSAGAVPPSRCAAPRASYRPGEHFPPLQSAPGGAGGPGKRKRESRAP